MAGRPAGVGRGVHDTEGGRASGDERGRRGAVAASVLVPSLRDLQWRARRFLLSALATGLVLGLALMMSGVANSFPAEIAATVRAVGASVWLVPEGSPGPFTAPATFPAAEVSALRTRPGLSSAAPLLISRALAATGRAVGADAAAVRDVNVLGVLPGRLGAPRVAAGRALEGPGQAVADDALGARVGERISLNGVGFRVVGLLHGVTYFAGQPVVFVDIHDLQRMVGAPVASAVLLEGSAARHVAGFSALGTAAVRGDLSRPVAQASQTIRLIEILLWAIAAAIVAAVIYLSALERRVEFAVLKSVGTPGSHLFFGLMIEAVVMALASACIGYGVEAAIAPTSALAVLVSPGDYLVVPILAVAVGVVASLVPARRAARVDPALAFGAGK